MKPALLAISCAAALLASCDGGSSATGPSNGSGTTTGQDVAATDLSSADKAFLAKLAGAKDGFAAMKEAGNSKEVGISGVGLGRRLDLAGTCTSPGITNDTSWTVNGVDVFDGSVDGAVLNVVQDTTTMFDAASGRDITCDYEAQSQGNPVRFVFRQAMIEGNLLTTHMYAEFLEAFDGTNGSVKGAMHGTVKYNNGFTLLIDTAIIDFSFSIDHEAEAAVYNTMQYKIRFEGYPYSTVLNFSASADGGMLVGDVIRDNSRIGIMKVFNDDRMEVRDLSGNLITP